MAVFYAYFYVSVKERCMFADIHNHVIYGVDDGASGEKETMALIDLARRTGTGIMCFTPHVYPEYFSDNAEAIVRNFGIVKEKASAAFPDMQFYLGSEIHYTPSTLSWIRDNKAFTMNGTDSVLLEFDTDDDTGKIIKAFATLDKEIRDDAVRLAGDFVKTVVQQAFGKDE